MKITFTHHAEERIARRQISKDEVSDAVKHPDSIIKKYVNTFIRKSLKEA
jgi:hypothetical protein